MWRLCSNFNFTRFSREDFEYRSPPYTSRLCRGLQRYFGILKMAAEDLTTDFVPNTMIILRILYFQDL